MDGNVEKQLATIKGQMPDTYAEIQRAAKAAGKGVYAVVRAGLRGEPNAFWACERGHVVGTPFEMRPAVAGEIASVIMQYGMTNLVFWSPTIAGVLHVELQSKAVATVDQVRAVPQFVGDAVGCAA